MSRRELALTLCENLPWKAPGGQLRINGCLELLEQLAAAEIIKLPVKQARSDYRAAGFRAKPLPETEIVVSLNEVRPVTVEPVTPEEQPVWDATMAEYHALASDALLALTNATLSAVNRAVRELFWALFCLRRQQGM